MKAPAHAHAVNDFWDPERELNFRPAKFLGEPDAARFLCKKLVAAYSEIVESERTANKTAPASVKAKLEKWRSGLLEIAGEMDNTSQTEYRVIVEAIPKSDEEFSKEITPLRWPGQGGQSKLSQLLREKADAFERLLGPIRERHEGTVWSKYNVGGRGHNLLHWLHAAKSRWQLIHMTWRVFEDLGCPLPPARDRSDLAAFLSLTHELATNERDVDFEADLKRYVKLRLEFDPLLRVLRTLGIRYKCETFHGLEQFLRHRTTPPTKPTAVLQQLITDVERYRSLRRQLLTGPDAIRRKRKPSKKS